MDASGSPSSSSDKGDVFFRSAKKGGRRAREIERKVRTPLRQRGADAFTASVKEVVTRCGVLIFDGVQIAVIGDVTRLCLFLIGVTSPGFEQGGGRVSCSSSSLAMSPLLLTVMSRSERRMMHGRMLYRWMRLFSSGERRGSGVVLKMGCLRGCSCCLLLGDVVSRQEVGVPLFFSCKGREPLWMRTEK